MKFTVRIGKVTDQARWRREDVRRMSPNERVRMLLDMQDLFFADQCQPLNTQIATRPHLCKSQKISAN